MSRLLAYLGPPLRPAPLIERLAEPPAGAPCGGLGLGWLAPDGAAARYLSDRPPPADVNLVGLGRSLESRLWIAYGRGLPGPAGPSPQPLVAGEWLWLLDCETTPPALRAAVLRHLTPPSEGLLERFDLPELLFTLFRQLLEEDEELTVEEALAETMALTTRLAGPLQLTLNLAVGDGQRLHLVRHATHRTPPALYYTTDEEGFPDGQLATGHPTDEGFWHPIPAGHRLTLDHDEPPDLVPL